MCLPIYVLVANLPYYIATAIIMRAIRDPMCRGFLVMVQKEVAEKFCATCGDSNFSALGVLSESIGKSLIVSDVPPEAFNPPPKVTSSIFFTKKILDRPPEGLEDMLKVAFSAPRKKLLGNLAKVYERDKIVEIFLSLDIDVNIRPHELDTTRYHHLLRELFFKGNE